MAIEVEKKFSVRDISKLIQGANFIKEITFTDIYFDNPSHDLTKGDIWFRKRDNLFELKIPLNKGVGSTTRKVDQYREITSQTEIGEFLKIPNSGNFERDLEKVGFAPFCAIRTTRKKYKFENMNIDIDSMDFGYSLCEIEILVDDSLNQEKAYEKIEKFSKKRKLSPGPVRGKVIEYLYRNSPLHFNELVESGVI